MKRFALLAAVALMGLSACAQLSEEDRALISSAGQNAEEAKNQSLLATEEARKASASAAQAAAAAQAAQQRADEAANAAKASGEKSDRIFRESQTK